MLNWWFAIPVLFIDGFVIDVFYALYFSKIAEFSRLSAVGDYRPALKIQAAVWSTLIGACSLIMIEGVVTNWVWGLAWLAGLFCGTMLFDKIESFFKNRFV